MIRTISFEIDPLRNGIRKLTEIWQHINWDPNARKRLLGYLQGLLYRYDPDSGDEDFATFNLKRKRERPRGDFDFIAEIIVGFVPIWAMLRNDKDNYWTAELPRHGRIAKELQECIITCTND